MSDGNKLLSYVSFYIALASLAADVDLFFMSRVCVFEVPVYIFDKCSSHLFSSSISSSSFLSSFFYFFFHFYTVSASYCSEFGFCFCCSCMTVSFIILRRIFPARDLGMAGTNLTPPRNFFTGETLPRQTKLLFQSEHFYLS